MVKRFLFSSTANSSIPLNVGLVLLRIFTGFAMAFGHGINKLPPSEGFVEGVAELGFPLPVLFGWSASISEFFGGLFMAIGLATRPWAILIAVTMAVAAFLRQGDDPFSTKEKALLFMFIAILFAFCGSGKYSVDRFIYKD